MWDGLLKKGRKEKGERGKPFMRCYLDSAVLQIGRSLHRTCLLMPNLESPRYNLLCKQLLEM